MADCSNLTNTTVVNLTKGTLPGGFCHSSLQDTYEKFIEATTAATIIGSTYVTTDDTPTGHEDRAWLKQDGSACADPLGWYYHDGTDWSNPVPVPVAALTGASGVTAGTYGGVTVAATGIVTAGTSVVTVTTGEPTGGANGDFHYKYYA